MLMMMLPPSGKTVFCNKNFNFMAMKDLIIMYRIVRAESVNVLYFIPEGDWDSVYVFVILQSSPRQTESQGKD